MKLITATIALALMAGACSNSKPEPVVTPPAQEVPVPPTTEPTVPPATEGSEPAPLPTDQDTPTRLPE